MTRRERLEARMERRQDWAAARERKSEAAHQQVAAIADGIPFGQPILVGHHSERHARRDQARMESGMAAMVDHARMAEEHATKAQGIAAQLATSIFSDDPDAVEQLEAKIGRLEAERDRIKAYNASCRKGQRDVSLLDEKQQAELASVAKHCPYQLGKNGSGPSYWTTSLGAEIRRCRERIAIIQRTAEMQERGERGRGKSMFSRYAGVCPDCGDPIEKGSSIIYYRVTREAVHSACVESAASAPDAREP